MAWTWWLVALFLCVGMGVCEQHQHLGEESHEREVTAYTVGTLYSTTLLPYLTSSDSYSYYKYVSATGYTSYVYQWYVDSQSVEVKVGIYTQSNASITNGLYSWTNLTVHYTNGFTYDTHGFQLTNKGPDATYVKFRVDGISASSTSSPTSSPSFSPSVSPTKSSPLVSLSPSSSPTKGIDTYTPTAVPSSTPSAASKTAVTSTPSSVPSAVPSNSPSSIPTAIPSSSSPSSAPSAVPSHSPSSIPSAIPSNSPSSAPTAVPSNPPSGTPTAVPSNSPSSTPTEVPSNSPSSTPTEVPSISPSSAPSAVPSISPSSVPTILPSTSLSSVPSAGPSNSTPSSLPSSVVSSEPSDAPTTFPSSPPSVSPSWKPTVRASSKPTAVPLLQPTSNAIVISCNPCGLRENGSSALVHVALASAPSTLTFVNFSIATVDAKSPATFKLSQNIVYFTSNNYSAGISIVVHSEVSGDKASQVYNFTATAFPYRFTASVKLYNFLIPPKPLPNATFFGTLNGLTVAFNGSTNELSTAVSFGCGLIFSNASKLGDGSTCLFTSSSELAVTFGSDSTSLPGDVLVIKDFSLLAPTSSSTVISEAPQDAYVSGSVMISKPMIPATPSAVIIGPTSVSKCTNVTLDGSQSTSSGGREFTYAWTITPQVESEYIGNTSSASFIIYEGGLNYSSYNVSLTVTNFIGDTASESVQLEVSSDSLVDLYISGPTKLSIYTWQKVSVFATASVPNCFTNFRKLDIQWSLSSSTSTSITSSVVSASNIARHLLVAANSLPGGSVTIFTVTAKVVEVPSSLASAQVTVTVHNSEIVLLIQGGSERTLITSHANTIEATVYDPDGCSLDTTVSCSSTVECIYVLDGTVVLLGENSLATGNYIFTFNTSCNADGRYKSASVWVTMKANGLPGASLNVYSPSTYELTDSFNPSERLVLKAVVTNSSRYSFSWAVDQVDASVFSTGSSGLYLAVSPGALSGSRIYKFTFTLSANGETSTTSISLYGNKAPASGSYQISPSTGYALITEFLLKLTNWVDTELPLAYSFGAIVGGTEVPLSASHPRNQLQTTLWKPADTDVLTVRGSVYDAYGAKSSKDGNVTFIADSSTSLSSVLVNVQDALNLERDGEKALRLLLAAGTVVSNDTERQTILNQVSNCSEYIDTGVDTLLQQVFVLDDVTPVSSSYDVISQTSSVLAYVVSRYNNSSDTASFTFTSTVVQIISIIGGSGLLNSSETASGQVLQVIDVISDRSAADLLVPGEPAEIITADSFQLYTGVFDTEHLVSIPSPWAAASLPSEALARTLGNAGTCGNVQVTSNSWASAANPYSWSTFVDVFATVISVEVKDCNHTAQAITNLSSPLTFNVIGSTSLSILGSIAAPNSSSQTCSSEFAILQFNCSNVVYSVNCSSYWPAVVNFTCPYSRSTCVYWDTETQRLNDTGCYVIEVFTEAGDVNTTCACTHLTSFTSQPISYGSSIQSTATFEPNKSNLKRSYAVVICIGILYSALIISQIGGATYDRLQEKHRLIKLLLRQKNFVRSPKAQSSRFIFDSDDNGSKPKVLALAESENIDGVLVRWIRGLKQENLGFIYSSPDDQTPTISAQQKGLLAFSRAITMLGLSCVFFENSSLSQDPRIAALSNSTNSGVWVYAMYTLFWEVFANILVSTIIARLFYVSFKEVVLMRKAYTQFEEKAWEHRRFLLALDSTAVAELQLVNAIQQLRSAKLQLEALERLTKAEIILSKGTGELPSEAGVRLLHKQLTTIKTKLAEVESLLAIKQEHITKTRMDSFRQDVSAVGYLAACKKLQLAVKHDEVEIKSYVIEGAITKEQKQLQSLEQEVRVLLRLSPLKMFLYNWFVREEPFSVSFTSSRKWLFSALSLLFVLGYDTILSLGILYWGLSRSNTAVKLALITLIVSVLLDVITVSPVIMLANSFMCYIAERMLCETIRNAARSIGLKDSHLTGPVAMERESEWLTMKSMFHTPLPSSLLSSVGGSEVL